MSPESAGFRNPTTIDIACIYEAGGLDAAWRAIEASRHSPRIRFSLALSLARNLEPGDREPFAERLEAFSAHRLPPRALRRMAFLLFDRGAIRQPDALIRAGGGKGRLRPKERYKIGQIRGLAALQRSLPPPLPARDLKAIAGADMPAPSGRKILYVLAAAPPFHQTGYTARTQIVADGLRGRGWNVVYATRPGYPDDRNDIAPALLAAHEARRYEIGGIPCRRLAEPRLTDGGLPHYLTAAAESLATLFGEEKPALVMAASNYVTAYPAMLAAQALGIPFVYDVRGVWEYTRAAKIAGWEKTERFALDQKLEEAVFAGADAIVTLGGGLRYNLIARGVPPEKIVLAHNCADLALFHPRPPAQDMRAAHGLARFDMVAGYAGTLSHYEGLDDLIDALAHLTAEGLNCGLLLIGDGAQRPELEDRVRAQGLQDRVVFVPPVAQEDLPPLLAGADCIVLPRKPFTVCEIVTPLKLVEAMAMGLPVVVSDVRALGELVDHGTTGLVFPAGDSQALAAALRRLHDDRAAGTALGTQARAFACTHFDSSRVTAHLAERLFQLARPPV